MGVLKSILNRESYLDKLYSVVRTISKQFKPEVADFLDLVRVSTIDVIEAIIKWREIKVLQCLRHLRCKVSDSISY